jgi:hypothetical protein
MPQLSGVSSPPGDRAPADVDAPEEFAVLAHVDFDISVDNSDPVRDLKADLVFGHGGVFVRPADEDAVCRCGGLQPCGRVDDVSRATPSPDSGRASRLTSASPVFTAMRTCSFLVAQPLVVRPQNRLDILPGQAARPST